MPIVTLTKKEVTELIKKVEKRRSVAQTYFLKTIPLLTGDHRDIVEVLVREFAKVDRIEIEAGK